MPNGRISGFRTMPEVDYRLNVPEQLGFVEKTSNGNVRQAVISLSSRRETPEERAIGVRSDYDTETARLAREYGTQYPGLIELMHRQEELRNIHERFAQEEKEQNAA